MKGLLTCLVGCPLLVMVMPCARLKNEVVRHGNEGDPNGHAVLTLSAQAQVKEQETLHIFHCIP